MPEQPRPEDELDWSDEALWPTPADMQPVSGPTAEQVDTLIENATRWADTRAFQTGQVTVLVRELVAAIDALRQRLAAVEQLHQQDWDKIGEEQAARAAAEQERDEADSYIATLEANVPLLKAENARLTEALELAYNAVDELCARPGTCLPVRPRTVLSPIEEEKA